MTNQNNNAQAAEQPLPSYGKLSFHQLGQDVVEAMTGVRQPFDFGPNYPGHAMCLINFNSLARIVDKYRVPVASAPVSGGEQSSAERTLGFNAGICVALQVVTSMDCGVTWREIVTAAGKKKLLDYAAHVEPEEWELAGFKQYAMSEMNERKPRKRAAIATPQASAETLSRFCPGCGSVGPVEDKYRDCCPDGNQARMIPARLAEQCRDLFRLAIQPLMADAAANDSSAPQPSKDGSCDE